MAYSEDQIGEALAALAANDGNVAQTRRDLKTAGWEPVPSRSTLQRWEEKERTPQTARDEAVSKNGHQKKEELAEQLRSLAWGLTQSMGEEQKRKEASFKDLATALGVVIDKLQLLEGEATSISERRGDAQTNVQINNQQSSYHSRLAKKYE